MSKLTAILDKSIVHPISELDQPTRDRVWEELLTRFRIVVPWILVEEVWTNYGSPGSKDAGVVQIMVDQLKTLQSYWIDEELNLIFEELILQKRTPRHLARPSDTLVRALLDLAPGEPKFREFLARLKVEKEENVRKRIEAQNELEGTLNAVGLPTKVTSEQDFFLNVIRPRHAAVYCDESHRMSLLNRLFGDQLAKRYPHYSRRIRRAIRALANRLDVIVLTPPPARRRRFPDRCARRWICSRRRDATRRRGGRDRGCPAR